MVNNGAFGKLCTYSCCQFPYVFRSSFPRLVHKPDFSVSGYYSFCLDFEQKLSAMGFEVTPSKTATLDLTPIKEKERTQKGSAAAPMKSSTMRVEETKITTTR